MRERGEDFFQQIGGLALGQAEDLDGDLLIYSEVEDGVISADLFFAVDASTVRMMFASDQLTDLIYEFWEHWKNDPENVEWRTMTFVVVEGRFNVEFAYPDQLSDDESEIERRPRAIQKQFGGLKVDYSRPK